MNTDFIIIIIILTLRTATENVLYNSSTSNDALLYRKDPQQNVKWRGTDDPDTKTACQMYGYRSTLKLRENNKLKEVPTGSGQKYGTDLHLGPASAATKRKSW